MDVIFSEVVLVQLYQVLGDLLDKVQQRLAAINYKQPLLGHQPFLRHLNFNDWVEFNKCIRNIRHYLASNE